MNYFIIFDKKLYIIFSSKVQYAIVVSLINIVQLKFILLLFEKNNFGNI